MFDFSDFLGFDNEGFGSVFDGAYKGGEFVNISTQAVLDLFKNADHEGFGEVAAQDVFVEVAPQDVEDYNIPRADQNGQDHLVGELLELILEINELC